MTSTPRRLDAMKLNKIDNTNGDQDKWPAGWDEQDEAEYAGLEAFLDKLTEGKPEANKHKRNWPTV